MEPSSFFAGVALTWAILCALVVLTAFAVSRPASASTQSPPSADDQRAPLGESLSVVRLGVGLLGTGALGALLWLHAHEAAGDLHRLAGGALLLAALIAAIHALRRQSLSPDQRGDA